MRPSRSSSLIPALLCVGLALAPLACAPDTPDEPAESESGSTEDSQTEEAGDTEGGMCVEFERLPLEIITIVDGSTVLPTLSANCEVSVSGLNEGSLDLELNCVDAEQLEHFVEIQAPAEVAPSGVEVGAQLQLELVEDRTNDLGSGEELLLSDAQGPLLAQIAWSYGGASWGPISVDYGSYCPPDDEFGETGPGFVRTTVEGLADPYEVFVGEPQVISDGSLEWDLRALDAYSACCHGATIDVALVRR